MKGYLKQKGIPTPDKPVPIETIYIYGEPFKKEKGKWYANKQYLEYIRRQKEISVEELESYEPQNKYEEEYDDELKESRKIYITKDLEKIRLQDRVNELENIIKELEKFIDLALEIYNDADVKTLLMVKDKLKENK